MIYVEDAETGEQIFVDTNDAGFQQRLRAAADERQAALPAAARKAGTRPVHRHHRRGPRAGAGPHRRAAQAAAAMTFAWPWMLLSLGAVPLLVLGYRRLLRAPGGAARPSWPRSAWSPLAPCRPGGAGTWRQRCFLAAMALLFVALARPAGDDLPAASRGHGGARLRRVRQHGRHRPGPEPDGRREGRGTRVRREAAGHHAARRGGVQRERPDHAAAHHRPGAGARRDRPADPPGRRRRSPAGCRPR